MNNSNDNSLENYRSFLLLTEIAGDEPLSQRELARRLGIAVGLVNSYLKNLVGKGYVRVKAFPRNRYAYLLTPTGITEKSRLACRHLSYFTGLYTVVRQDYLNLFRSLEDRGVRQVIFCGVDEVAEIAYMSLRETGLELVKIVDDLSCGREFLGNTALPLAELDNDDTLVVITSLKRGDALWETLRQRGFAHRLVRP